MANKSAYSGKAFPVQDGDTLACTAADLCHAVRFIDAGTRNSEVFEIFEAAPQIQCLPVLADGLLVGLINRQSFMVQIAGRFHWEVYGKKRCTKVMDDAPVRIDAAMRIHEIADRLVGDVPGGLPESFVIVCDGKLQGVGFTSDVLAALRQHERRAADELRQHRDRLFAMIEERTRDLRLAKQEAERANRAKSDFLTRMSHELRTPLHAIMAFSQLGTQRHSDADRPRLGSFFARIHESTVKLSLLVDDLLSLSRLDTGRIVLDLGYTDLGELLATVRDTFADTAGHRNIVVRVDRPEAPTPLRADAQRIGQVLTNVLGNALKFSPLNSEIVLRLAVEYSGTAEPAVGYRLDVIDQGPGIPDDEMESIFESFNLSSRTQTGAGGVGLGLSISREIMHLHGGGITARNLPAGGACFSLHFPRA